jgi:TusA-related sulfurtransferase
MPDEKVVDLRGYSCPQPQMIAFTEIHKMKQGKMIILVNPGNPKENVSKTAIQAKCKVEAVDKGDHFMLVIEK